MGFDPSQHAKFAETEDEHESIDYVASIVAQSTAANNKPLTMINSNGIVPPVGEMIPEGVNVTYDGVKKEYPARYLGPATRQDYIEQFAGDEKLMRETRDTLAQIDPYGELKFMFVEIVD